MFHRPSASERLLAWSCGAAVLLLSIMAGRAWGPHNEITQAALDTLATNDSLVLRLEAQARELTNYCWMGDYHRVVCEAGNELFYADDYLLFPGSTPQWEHFGPWLKTTFRPCFRRAVQALQTESPSNAARWIGALLHFVQDAGAPPHALAIRGPMHSRLEGWIDTNAIRLTGYTPRKLGSNEKETEEVLCQRLDKLGELALKRGRSLKLHAELGNRSGVKPGVLECALETGRLTADLLHTLGSLPSSPSNSSAALEGWIRSAPSSGVERFAAKIVLQGSNFSTLADLSGHYLFLHLPPGHYRLVAMRPGADLAETPIDLLAGQTNRCDLTLAQKPSNLIRNSAFKLRWATTNSADCWYQTKTGWEGEFIPLRNGQPYRVVANFKPGANASVVVRWAQDYDHPLPAFRLIPRLSSSTLTPRSNTLSFSGSKEKGVAQLVIKDAIQPEAVLESLVLEPLADPTTKP